ncbi:MAG: L-threonylcarbamoyladenylate synthase [Thermoproteota archaeon]
MSLVIKINSKNPEISKIRVAAETLRSGGLVAFPTETVYGLGADALNAKAVKKIFEVKGRPADNPLIVHIADREEVNRLSSNIPRDAERLMNKFWPGPLTLVLKKSKIVPSITTAGLDTVAIRMPAHNVAFALIREAKTPIAAPSANLAGKPSPTSAEHVIEDLYGKIDVIIDAGRTKIGLESTVIDLTTDPVTLLRPGRITLEELRNILGKIKIHPAVKAKSEFKGIAKSPGMKYRHYSPDADVIVVEGELKKVKRKIQELIDEYKKEGKNVGIMTTSEYHGYRGDVVKFIGKDQTTIAKNLFKAFREFDKDRIDVIFVEGISERGFGLAIMNRLRKASGYNVIRV